MADTSKLIVANWKMNGDLLLLQEWLNELNVSHYQVVLCPPFPFLAPAKEHLHQIKIGAQDCHFEDKGAFTGFISSSMLKNVGCDYVIVGHSERRAFETDEDVGKKADAAMKVGLVPILCVGEPLNVRKEGNHINFVLNQLKNSLKNLPANKEIIIAYEPLWAIGSGLTAEKKDIEEMHKAIKEVTHLPVLYGGSVKPDNAPIILNTPFVEGLLVGGASLNINDFNAILSV